MHDQHPNQIPAILRHQHLGAGIGKLQLQPRLKTGCRSRIVKLDK